MIGHFLWNLAGLLALFSLCTGVALAMSADLHENWEDWPWDFRIKSIASIFGSSVGAVMCLIEAIATVRL